MEYVCVKWLHDLPDEPVWLYSELDEARWEVRKVYVFADNHKEWADSSREAGKTWLGLEPFPALSEIQKDTQFEPKIITKTEFEKVWVEATQDSRTTP